MLTFYIATTNPGKLRDFATVADGRCTILPLPGLANTPAPPEDEPTFEGNALIKARAYALRSPGLLILADDSGLEVDALDGAPGVRSARYAEDLNFEAPLGTNPDQRNNLCLIAALTTSGEPARYTARYRCALALVRSGTQVETETLAVAQGTLEGEILTKPSGTGGFGYDPLFYIPGLGKTMAELDPVTRLTVGHRGRALNNLLSEEALMNRLQNLA